MRLRNTGTYPIRITGVVGADGGKATSFIGSGCGAVGASISDNFYLAPGEEKYFAVARFYGVTCEWYVYGITGASTGASVGGASSVCQNSSASPGILDYKSLGFEYIQYIDNQQITKKQIGRDFIVKCMEPMN